ncbi:hypothetical protein V8D89_002597 [Ganoderma adspersum]
MVELKGPKARKDDIQPASGAPPLEHAPQPAPYLRLLPEQSLVISRDTRYRVDQSYPTSPGNFVNGREEIVKLQSMPLDPFPEGAVAQLPGLRGVSYVKTGDAWLLAPLPVTTPVWLSGPAPEHDEYWVVRRPRCPINTRPVDPGEPQYCAWALTVPFNVPLSRAKAGDFFGAGRDPPVFRYPADHWLRGVRVEDEVRVIIELPGMLEEQMVLSTQTNEAATKNEVATQIALEVEKVFNNPNIVLVAFVERELRKEVRFDDMFLVNLTQLSTEEFGATLAVRLEDTEPY